MMMTLKRVERLPDEQSRTFYDRSGGKPILDRQRRNRHELR
jgi:hypothetical protein